MVKKVFQGIGICMLMIAVSWVPESDLPQPAEESALEKVVTAIYQGAYQVNVWKEARTKEETIVEKENTPETPEIVPKIVEESVADEVYTEEVFDEYGAENDTETDEWGNSLVYLGEYDITAYEWTGNPCANGNYPTVGYTVACNSLPLGTVLYIDGVGYRTVEDRGATWHSDWWIDLYLGDVDACFEWGIRTRSVWIVE